MSAECIAATALANEAEVARCIAERSRGNIEAEFDLIDRVCPGASIDIGDYQAAHAIVVSEIRKRGGK